MSREAKHIVIPLALIAIFFLVAATPVDLLGCRNRGMIAVGLALACGLTGIATAIKALAGKVRRHQGSEWWMASTLILAIPAAYIVFIAR
jgi:hypothetical protein